MLPRHFAFAPVLLAALALPAQQRPPSLTDQAFAKLAASYDKDKDGKIAKAEYPRGDAAFANLDRDGDGVITRADFEPRNRRGSPRQPRARGRDGERGGTRPQPATTPPTVGEMAPDFELPLLGFEETVKLSSFRGKQPVALIFGSYT